MVPISRVYKGGLVGVGGVVREKENHYPFQHWTPDSRQNHRALQGRPRGRDNFTFPFLRLEKLQNESSPNFYFSSLSPEVCSKISRSFRASFCGKQRPQEIHQNPRHFSVQNSQANSKKKSTKFFWRAGKATLFQVLPLFQGCQPLMLWHAIETKRMTYIQKVKRMI